MMVMTTSADHTVWPPSNMHAHVLPYGMINWATKGFSSVSVTSTSLPQPDDVFSWGDEWDPVRHS